MKRFLILIFTLALITSSCTKKELKSRNGTYSGIEVLPLYDSNGRAGNDTTYNVTFTIKFKNNSRVMVNGTKYKFKDGNIDPIDTQKKYTSSGRFFADDSLYWQTGGLIAPSFYLKKH